MLNNKSKICICGGSLKDKTRHYKTKKHLSFINNSKDTSDDTMNTNQLLFINSDIKNCILTGNPGCGKTKTIIEYCIDKYNKKIIKSGNNFMIISFSKKAQLDFIKRGKTSSQPNLFNNKNVKTIHSLSKSIFDKLFNKSSNTINTIILATFKNLLNNSDDLIKINSLQNCSFIIVDEAQDINENQYNLIKLISNVLNIPLILVGDPNQNIYQFQGGSDQFLMNHEKDNIFNLIQNYRSTNQIVQFCNHIRPYNYLPKMISGKNTNDSKPLIYCNTIENILEHIKNELTNSEYELHDIAIIGPVKLSKPKDGIYSSIGLQLICNYLEKKKIKFVKHFKDPENKEFNSKEDFEIKENHVNILTSHGSKGLEFKKTLVINFHFNTFSKMPTENEYIQFKYLWYVTLSRAINKLIIYVDSSKKIFPEIFKVPNELYTTNIEIKEFKIKFGNDITPFHYPITKTLNDNKYFNENTFYEFNNSFKHTIQKEQLFELDESDIFEYDKYSCLYGLFIEKLFIFYYYKNKDDLLNFINICKNKLNNILFIDRKHIKIYKILKNKNIIDDTCTLYYDNIDKNKLSTEEYEFILYCYDKIKSNVITIYIKNDLFNYDKSYLINLYDSLLVNHSDWDTLSLLQSGVSGPLCTVNKSEAFINPEVSDSKASLLKLSRSLDPPEKIIFDIILYFYQIENECVYILNSDFTEHLKSLESYYIKLNELSKKCNDFQFHIYNKHANINLMGEMDILYKNQIIELKFINSVNEKHIIQTLLYYNNYCIDWSIEKDIEIWNFKDGYKYIILFDNNFTCWDFNCFICKTLNIKMINNIFVLDLETNTKDCSIDFTEPSNTEIIDRFVYEYNFNCIISDGLIKNISPLTTTHITGITKAHLKKADKDLSKFKLEMDTIMLYCNNPLFIGHNAKRFDLPILFYYKLLDQNKIKILDSMYFIRLFVHDKNISNKLINLYNFILNTNVEQTHRAKGDTMLIVDICRKLNLKSNDLIKMCDTKTY